MSAVTIRPRLLAGAVTPPPSKSQAHRMLLCAALAHGDSRLNNIALSEDIQATLNCIQALGASWRWSGEGELAITGMGGVPRAPRELPRFDCGESGSTLRFLIPIALATAGGGVFTGRGRLMERPQGPYLDLFDQKGIFYEQADGVLTVRGKLEAGEYSIPGHVSSQFLTGLLLALPLVGGDSRIRLTTPLESGDYVSMTLEAMEEFGVAVARREDGFDLSGGQSYRGREGRVEADWSQAAFWYAANFLGSGVDIQGLNPRSSQGDLRVAGHYWKLAKPGEVELDVSQCPDLVPPLAVMAALRRGTCSLVNGARLRLKESDRLSAVTQVLSALGARMEEGADHLTIHGLNRLAGGVTVECHNDHRIAMMAAVAATQCQEPITLLGAECVNKSYPQFWDHYRMLGGDVNVVVSG